MIDGHKRFLCLFVGGGEAGTFTHEKDKSDDHEGGMPQKHILRIQYHRNKANGNHNERDMGGHDERGAHLFFSLPVMCLSDRLEGALSSLSALEIRKPLSPSYNRQSQNTRLC